MFVTYKMFVLNPQLGSNPQPTASEGRAMNTNTNWAVAIYVTIMYTYLFMLHHVLYRATSPIKCYEVSTCLIISRNCLNIVPQAFTSRITVNILTTLHPHLLWTKPQLPRTSKTCGNWLSWSLTICYTHARFKLKSVNFVKFICFKNSLLSGCAAHFS